MVLFCPSFYGGICTNILSYYFYFISEYANCQLFLYRIVTVRYLYLCSRQASAAARSVMRTNTATTSSSVKDHERWMTLRENTFPTVSTRISSVEMTSTIFSTAASAFMSFLYTFILFPLLYIFPVSDPYRVV